MLSSNQSTSHVISPSLSNTTVQGGPGSITTVLSSVKANVPSLVCVYVCLCVCLRLCLCLSISDEDIAHGHVVVHVYVYLESSDCQIPSCIR